MSVQEAAQAIGRRGLLDSKDQILVPVRVLDVKTAYGVPRYRVEPYEKGSRRNLGSAWVIASRVTLE